MAIAIAVNLGSRKAVIASGQNEVWCSIVIEISPDGGAVNKPQYRTGLIRDAECSVALVGIELRAPKSRVLPARNEDILIAIVVKIHPRAGVSSGAQHAGNLLGESPVPVVVADRCKARLGD